MSAPRVFLRSCYKARFAVGTHAEALKKYFSADVNAKTDLFSRVTLNGEEMLVKLLRGGKLVDTYFHFTYEAYRETDGTISGVTIIAYEVTTQTKLNQKVRESESYFRLMAESMPEKISNADAHGNILFYNKSWLDYTGLTLEDMLNQGGQQWMYPEEVEQIRQKMAEIGSRWF